MKRILDLRGTMLFALVLLAAVLSGCDGQQNDSLATFFNVVQTVLLGVTAAGAVAIIKNV
jgi:hypothetical protein